MKTVTAEALTNRFGMVCHAENGLFRERHYVWAEQGRAASGSIYYYVAPDEISKFHTIDCDEYWVYVAGSPLELCSVAPDGSISRAMLGADEGCEPLHYFKAGVIFASRHPKQEQEGTFLVCITVPRFAPEGFRIYEQEEILRKYPALASFFELP